MVVHQQNSLAVFSHVEPQGLKKANHSLSKKTLFLILLKMGPHKLQESRICDLSMKMKKIDIRKLNMWKNVNVHSPCCQQCTCSRSCEYTHFYQIHYYLKVGPQMHILIHNVLYTLETKSITSYSITFHSFIWILPIQEKKSSDHDIETQLLEVSMKCRLPIQKLLQNSAPLLKLMP